MTALAAAEVKLMIAGKAPDSVPRMFEPDYHDASGCFSYAKTTWLALIRACQGKIGVPTSTVSRVRCGDRYTRASWSRLANNLTLAEH